MNCKPGDLAVCIAGVYPQFIGRVFTVTNLCPVHLDSWDTDPPQFVAGYKLPVSFHDKTLRPLRDRDGEDEVLRMVGRPAGSKQAA